ncbi:hypothetical protein FOZ60_014093 [Perkinsus olseni]|uniref:Uncharacterized protein n=2 Tax=Perkinsus olseni TaxID=32597 RepID=A0A7J6P7S1_PEROL|nr:hypothetical protein FOZ60_014093 [Perkinsus olseni]
MLMHGCSSHQRRSFAGMVRSRRDFWQKLNEQYLSSELAHIGRACEEAAKGNVTPKQAWKNAASAAPFDPKIPGSLKLRGSKSTVAGPIMARNAQKAAKLQAEKVLLEEEHERILSRRGMTEGGRNTAVVETAREPSGEQQFGDGRGNEPGDRLWSYESRRHEPRYQDLLHEDARRLQELCHRKRMMDRKLKWLKENNLPDPAKVAKYMTRVKKSREREPGGEMYPPPFQTESPNVKKETKMLSQAERDTLESRLRSKIREEKKLNVRVLRQSEPAVGEVITDPIARHRAMRKLRTRSIISEHLDGILTSNSAQIMWSMLDGASVSVAKIHSEGPRGTHRIFYNLNSDHDPEEVHRKLNILAPKIRSLLAVKLNLGRTPPLKCVNGKTSIPWN